MLKEGDFTFQVFQVLLFKCQSFENKVNIKNTKLGDESRNFEMNDTKGG